MSRLGITVDEGLLILMVVATFAIWGCIDSPGDGVKVITIGASDCEDHVASFSGSGPTRDGRTKPTVLAPGVDVVSAVPPGLEEPDYIDVYYAKQSGTSISTPVAAGVAALLLQAEPDMTPAGIKATMTRGARKLNNTLGEEYEPYYQGAGLIDAYRSYEILDDGICGVMPDRLIAGRWAFPSGGKAISPGLDAGADEAQKKIYAMAPNDEDWTTRFVFFTNRARSNLSTVVTGQVSSWVSAQPMGGNIPENGQRVFGATVNVPNATPPGLYRGEIEILEGGEVILSIPTSVEVARPMPIVAGQGRVAGLLDRNQWDYYFLEIPTGMDRLEARLSWIDAADLDIFMLAPTSEYYTSNESTLQENVDISDPPSGRWIVAVHGRNLTQPVNYSLNVNQAYLDSSPKRWNLGAVQRGESVEASFSVTNFGPGMADLATSGVAEKAAPSSTEGEVGNDGVWEEAVLIAQDTSRLNIRLDWVEESSDLDLRLYGPDGDLVASSEGFTQEEEVNYFNPEPGAWKVEVRGYEVKRGKQPFNLDIIIYSQEDWPWISVRGPSSLESGEMATLEARIDLPSDALGGRFDGFIKLEWEDGSHLIPVSLTVAGASVMGISQMETFDRDGDGYIDQLIIGVEVEAAIPGVYRLEGALVDCNGDVVDWLWRTEMVEGDELILLEAGGVDVWRRANCGPLKIGPLFLYDELGELIDQRDGNESIDKAPEEFQPPSAYLNGSFEMKGSWGRVKKVEIAVGLVVVKPGIYELKGVLEDDQDREIDSDTKMEMLQPGNHTIVLDFNPTKFLMLSRSSRLHLRDLTLSLGGSEIERLDEAWSSERMDPAELIQEG